MAQSLGSTSDGGIESRDWFHDPHHLESNEPLLERSALYFLDLYGKLSVLCGKSKSQANLSNDRAGGLSPVAAILYTFFGGENLLEVYIKVY